MGHQGVLFIDRLPERAAPLRGEERAALAIVGGGLTGLATALAVRERFPQRRIVLLEADRCGTGASGRNGGMALTGTSLDLDDLEARLGFDRARRVNAWLARGLALLRERAQQSGAAAAVQTTGTLSLARTARHLRAQRRRLEVYRRFGVEAEWLEGPAFERTLRSPLYRAAFHVPGQAALVDPWRLVTGLRRLAIERGILVHEDSAVLSVEEGSEVRLTTAGGRVTAPSVVLATNAFTPRLGFFRRQIAPVHVSCVATAPLPKAARAAIGWDGRQAAWEEGRVYHFLRLTADDRVLLGGGNIDYRIGGGLHFDATRRHEKLVRALRRIFPPLRNVPVTHRWSGVVDFSRDFLPSFGVTGRAHNLYYALGYTGHGVALTHLAGETLASLYAGDALPDEARFLVGRRLPTVGFEPLRWLVVNAVRNGWLMLERLGW
ncbi:MAG TPA: FAD-binding oxidoreductase [Candidatus Polarisedimenticolia bacterium]|nr:FAD-binding oxidoreductase [Candidatus Polarisedimenticolia bacterium]